MRPSALRSLPATLALAAACLVPFVVLLVAVLAADLQPLAMDTRWATTVASLTSPAMTSFQQVVSAVGGDVLGGLVVPVLVGLVLWRVRSWRAATVFVVVVLGSAVVVQVVKHVVARPRPPAALLPGDLTSFPSGHVTNAATLTLVLALLVRRRSTVALAIVWPVLMIVSRTYLHVHWLSDTLAAASLGVAVALGATPVAAMLLDRLAPPSVASPPLISLPAPGPTDLPGSPRAAGAATGAADAASGGPT